MEITSRFGRVVRAKPTEEIEKEIHQKDKASMETVVMTHSQEWPWCGVFKKMSCPVCCILKYLLGNTCCSCTKIGPRDADKDDFTWWLIRVKYTCPLPSSTHHKTIIKSFPEKEYACMAREWTLNSLLTCEYLSSPLNMVLFMHIAYNHSVC